VSGPWKIRPRHLFVFRRFSRGRRERPCGKRRSNLGPGLQVETNPQVPAVRSPSAFYLASFLYDNQPQHAETLQWMWLRTKSFKRTCTAPRREVVRAANPVKRAVFHLVHASSTTLTTTVDNISHKCYIVGWLPLSGAHSPVSVVWDITRGAPRACNSCACVWDG